MVSHGGSHGASHGFVQTLICNLWVVTTLRQQFDDMGVGATPSEPLVTFRRCMGKVPPLNGGTQLTFQSYKVSLSFGTGIWHSSYSSHSFLESSVYRGRGLPAPCRETIQSHRENMGKLPNPQSLGIRQYFRKESMECVDMRI